MKSQAIKPMFALLLACCCALSFQTMANPITRQQAQQNAFAFMHDRGKSITVTSLCHAPMRATQSDELQPYYVFNIGDNQGYVIASGDDCVPAVLGYSDEGYIDLDNLPCNIQPLFDKYAQYIRSLQDRGLNVKYVPPKTDDHPAIPRMLTCFWGQRDPYNRNCPIDPTTGKRCLTGCVATAMAQIMYYYRERSVNATTTEIPAYTTYTREINVEAIPAGSFIDWDNMVDKYITNPYYAPSQENCEAVANLMKYCGAALKIDYTSDASGAGKIDKALIPFFNYSPLTKDVNSYHYSDEEWDELIYHELSNGRPVEYSIMSMAHAVVVDGYDGNGYFHLNQGGHEQSVSMADGWFLLTSINSGADHATINTEPMPVPLSDDEGSGIHFADPKARAVCLWIADADGDCVLTESEAAAVTDASRICFRYTPITSLDEFRFFRGASSIDSETFYQCHELTSVKIPNTIVTIGDHAFDGCDKLTSIVIPKTVNAIGYNAFYGGALRNVICLSSTPPDMNYSFLFDNAILCVPIEAVDRYKATPQWNQFSSIVGLDPSLGDINLDGEVNIADINAAIGSILKPGDDCLYDFMGDVNGDDEVNIADVNALIDKILHHQ